MAWRTMATGITVIFVLVVTLAVLADPFVQIANAFQDLQTSGQFNTNTKIDDLVSSWFSMFLIAIFGIMAWVGWRYLRKELVKQGL